jgi:hypothetical protein
MVCRCWWILTPRTTLAAGADHFGLQVDGTGGGGTLYAWGGHVELGQQLYSKHHRCRRRAADRQWVAGQTITVPAGLSAANGRSSRRIFRRAVR